MGCAGSVTRTRVAVPLKPLALGKSTEDYEKPKPKVVEQPYILVPPNPSAVLENARMVNEVPPNPSAILENARAVNEVRPRAYVEQPQVLVERQLAVVGGHRLEVTKDASELPMHVEMTLAEAQLLTEVNVASNQTRTCQRRLEVLVGGRVVVAGPLCDSAERPDPAATAAGRLRTSRETPSRCRMQLDEPVDNVKVFTLRIVDGIAVPRKGAGAIELYEVVPRGLPVGSEPPRRRLLRPPEYWQATEVSPCKRIDLSDDKVAIFQRLLDETWRRRATRDRRGEMPTRLRVRKAQRVEAPALWNSFSRHRRQMLLQRPSVGCTPIESSRGDPEAGMVRTKRVCDSAPEVFGSCERRVNEHYLFHGSSPHGALGIIHNGFDLRRAGESCGMLFGPGAYFAEASSKFDEYALPDEFSNLCAVLICRVLCGEMYRTLNKLDPNVLLEPSFVDQFDAVLGDREASVGTYREFVVFKQEQVYPEYIVLYDREY